MILTIIAAAVLFGYMLTSLYLTQTLAQGIADMNVNRWVLMFMINLLLLVCGFFIPPAAIILMTCRSCCRSSPRRVSIRFGSASS